MPPGLKPNIIKRPSTKAEDTDKESLLQDVPLIEEKVDHDDFLMDEVTSKKKDKEAKKKRKQKCNFEKIDYEMSQGSFRTASKLLMHYITTFTYEREEFKGVGCVQNWQGLNIGNGGEWYRKAKEQNIVGYNPYDLLSISLNFSSHNKENDQMNEDLYWYATLEVRQNEMEIAVGMGNLYYGNKEYFKAEGQYLRAIQLGCELDRVYESLAWIYCCQFELNDKGKEYAMKALNLNPENMQAKLLLYLSNPDEQLRKVNLYALLQDFPEYYRIYYEISRCSNDPLEKLSVLQTIFNDYNSNYVPALLYKAYLKRQNLSQAVKICNKVLSINSNDDMAHWCIAKIHESVKLHMSHGNYRLSLLYNPYCLLSLKHYAIYLKKIKRTQDSMTYLQRYLEQNPYDYGVYSLQGIIYMSMNRFRESEDCLAKAIELSSSFSFSLSSHIDFARFLMQKKKYEGAKNAYLLIHKYQRTNSEVLFSLSNCCIELEQYQEAIKWCFICLEHKKDIANKQILFNLAECFEKLGQYLLAMDVYLEYSFISNTLLTPQLFHNYNKLPREQSILFLEPMLDREANGFFYIQLGLLFVQLGEPEFADRAFESASKKNDRNLIPYLEQYYGVETPIREQMLRFFGIVSLRQRARYTSAKRSFQVQFTNLFKYGSSFSV